MLLANIILDIQTRSLSKAFTYVATDDVKVGNIVMVPFGNQYKCGFVIELKEGSSEGLKEISKVLSKSYFDETSVEFAKYISKRYLSSLASCMRLFTPPGSIAKCKKIENKWILIEPQVKEINDKYIVKGENFYNFIPKSNAIKQKLIIDALRSGEIKYSDLALQFGSISSAVKTLEKNGVVQTLFKRKIRDINYKLEEEKKINLTKGQNEALEVINNSDKQVIVVDGVTGSGKTEVYLRAIHDNLKKGKSAIVLVPEISLTPQTVARFRTRFGDTVAVLHSKMSVGERYDQWDLILQQKAKVVVGARSALFAPVKNLGIIVIDEEHESSYKQESSPRYVTRDCAEWLAYKTGAKLVLGSATPSIEALYKSENDNNWTRVYLPERTNKLPMPEIKIVDMGLEFKNGSNDLFSQALKKEIKNTVEKNQKVLLLHNRRGFANYMFCRECGHIPRCEHCSTSLTYHSRLYIDDKYKEMLFCHHCGHLEHVSARCPKCKSPYFAKLGAGTQSVEDQLYELFPDVNIVRMDADTTRKKDGHFKCLEEFSKPGAAILLGTQMIAKGLDFADVALVGVVLADTNLSLPDFRSEERTFNLIAQVAGRAGRDKISGKVIVQTYNPDNISINSAAKYDRNLFVSEQFKKRMLLKYPPFVKLANIIVYGTDESEVEQEAIELTEHIDSYAISKDLGWEVCRATSCVLSKLRNKYRYHILIKSENEISQNLDDILNKYKFRKNISITIDIDPISLY